MRPIFLVSKGILAKLTTADRWQNSKQKKNNFSHECPLLVLLGTSTAIYTYLADIYGTDLESICFKPINYIIFLYYLLNTFTVLETNFFFLKKFAVVSILKWLFVKIFLIKEDSVTIVSL